MELVHAQAAARGLPGPVPPQDPTLEEALRLYARHTRTFDASPAVKLSVFTMNVEIARAKGQGTFEEAVLAEHRRMETLLSDYAHGEPASDVATRYGLRKQDWWVASEDWVEYPSEKIGAPREGEMEGWAFSQDRRPGERRVFEPSDGVVMGIAIHAIRETRARPFEEVRENVVNQIRWVRASKHRLARQLVLLGSASIHPASLSEELQAKTREELRSINENPVWRDIEAD